MFTATGSATYSATSSGTGSGSGNTEIDAVNAANSAALIAAQDGIATILNTFVSSTTLYLAEKNLDTDKIHIITFNYYWNTYPDLFGRIQIVYTDVDENGNLITNSEIIIQNNIKYLNIYYNKGYRLFVGFNTSSVLAGVLEWFKNVGTKAKGISLNSAASALNIPKPVYRLQNNTNQLVNALDFILSDASKIYYIYNANQLVCLNLIPLFKKYNVELILYPVNPDLSNLTLSNIKELYKNADEKSISTMFLFVRTSQSDFVNLFNHSYLMPTSTYDLQKVTFPKINETSKNALINKYNYLNNVSFSTSQLYRNGLNSLKELFSTYVPNALLLINKLVVNGDIETLPSHNSVLEFNENNDIKYFTFLNLIYSKDDKGEYYYKEDFYSIYDPIVGKQIFYLNK